MGVGHQLALAFYSHVKHDPVLGPVYPTHLKCSMEALGSFLDQFLGGPCEYSERRPSLSLREAHLRFKIGRKERDAWLKIMSKAMDEVEIDQPSREALRQFFEEYSAYLVNTEGPPEYNSERMEHEIAQRWNIQRTLEEAVAAVRHGDAGRALDLVEGDLLQTYFKRDGAAFLSLLAIMSGSANAVLLDYVRQNLFSHPELAGERYTGRTLLHDAAGEGSLSIVELLLEIGADPNAVDRAGHTPLYYVGNRCERESGADVIHVLVEQGADVNAQGGVKNCSALHMAARRGNVRVAEALLDCGANIEAQDSAGDTPLRRAVNCGKPEVVSFLLSRGANIHSKGNRGLTPLQAARCAAMKRVLQVTR